eukprot:7693067-Pyramimonas_sp.AAC.1
MLRSSIVNVGHSMSSLPRSLPHRHHHNLPSHFCRSRHRSPPSMRQCRHHHRHSDIIGSAVSSIGA